MVEHVSPARKKTLLLEFLLSGCVKTAKAERARGQMGPRIWCCVPWCWLIVFP